MAWPTRCWCSWACLQAPKAWLSDTFWTMNVIILADAWKTVPNMTLLLLAGLQPISADLYEAAEVDGATRWQKFTAHHPAAAAPGDPGGGCAAHHRRLPVFDIIYVLTGNGGPADSTKVISFYAYDQAFHYLFFGYGAAISWLITAFMLVLIVIYMRWLRSEVRAYNMPRARGNLLSPATRWLLLLFYLVFTLLPIVWLFLSTIQTQASLLTLPRADHAVRGHAARTTSISSSRRPLARTAASPPFCWRCATA